MYMTDCRKDLLPVLGDSALINPGAELNSDGIDELSNTDSERGSGNSLVSELESVELESGDEEDDDDEDVVEREDNDERLEREESEPISESIDMQSTSISSSSSSSASSFSISRSYASKNSFRSDFRGMIA